MSSARPIPAGLAGRLDRLAPRERRLLAVGAAAIAAFAVYLLLPGADGEEAAEAPPVELAEAPPSAATLSYEAPPAPVAIPEPAASPAGLVLHGVLGGGPGGGAAIVSDGGGVQRTVRVSRPVVAGLTLKEVGIAHMLLTGAGGDFRLEFNKAARPAATSIAVQDQAAAPPADRRRETLQYRMGLEPRSSNGRVMGYAVKPGADMPLLVRAGLQPGDVIVKVNGDAMRSDEKVLELAEELGSAYTAEIEYLRGGQRKVAKLEVNKRPD